MPHTASYLGCYSPYSPRYALPESMAVDDADLTVASCVYGCFEEGFPVAGMEQVGEFARSTICTFPYYARVPTGQRLLLRPIPPGRQAQEAGG